MFAMFGLARTSSEKMRAGTYENSSSWPENIKENATILTESEQEMVKMLLDMGQHHLFATWDPPGISDDSKHLFFEQLQVLHNGYVGGLGTYVRRAKTLLANAKAGVNPFAGLKPEVPSGIRIEPYTPDYDRYEQQGLSHIGKCGFVLVAGGLGERLGYNGIKVELPSETLTSTCYLELYCQQILYMQKRYAAPGMKLPLAIMVSDDTATKTEALLEFGNYFGLERGQITLMKQGKVPALLSNAAHIALASQYEIDAKPHGHGDVHALLNSTGTIRRWQEAGVEWVNFFQDTNGLAFFALPAMIGVSVELGLEVNSLSIKRHAKQAIGAITKLVPTTSETMGEGAEASAGVEAETETNLKEMTINVEYNQLDPLLRATISPEGDVNDPDTGLSPFPGNINQLLFMMEPYAAMLERTQGVMPEFVNPKYSDESKTMFKKPTRLECMMQDYPKLLPAGAKVGFTTVPSWLCYSACKNNSKDAAEAVKKGIPAASPFTAESDQYNVSAELLRRLGADIEAAEEVDVGGIWAIPSPRIVVHPSCATFPAELRARFNGGDASKVQVTARSSLVLLGDVTVEHLRLDGALRVEATPGTVVTVRAGDPNLTQVTNEGYVMDMLLGGTGTGTGVDAPSEIDRMRGYKLRCVDQCSVSSAAVSHNLKQQINVASNSSTHNNLPSKDATTDISPSRTAEPQQQQRFIFNGRSLIDECAYIGDRTQPGGDDCNLACCF